MAKELDMTADEARGLDRERYDGTVGLCRDAELALSAAREALRLAAIAVPSVSVARRLRAYETVLADPEVYCRRTAGQYAAGQQEVDHG